MKKNTKKKSVKISTKNLKNKLQFKLPSMEQLKAKFESDKLIKGLILGLVFLFSFALVDLLVQYLNNSYSIAIVNGVRITKAQYHDRLEKTYGTAAVQGLIQEQLVQQGAQEAGVTVSSDQVQTRLNEYYNENGGRDAVLQSLKASNVTEDDIKEQVKIGLLLEDTLSKQVSYDDDALKEFFNQYKSVIYGTQKVTFEDKKDEIKQYYTNEQVQNLKSEWLTGLESQAKIQNNVVVAPKYGFLKTSSTIVRNLITEIKSQLNK